MNSKLLWIFGAVFVLLLLPIVFSERWTTPADELRAILGYYRFLETREQSHFETHGRYAELRDLFGDKSGGFRVTSECQDGYCFQVHSTKDKYSISIVPNKAVQKARLRLMSLYADESRVVRPKNGSPTADSP